MVKKKEDLIAKAKIDSFSKKNSKYYSIVIAVILALFLVSSSIFYLMSSKDFKRGDLVGDAICGNFANEQSQNKCCSDLHENDVTIKCVGEWEYVSGTTQCQYLCLGSLPSCTEEAKVCPNGKTVVRVPENDCKFEDC